jgi:hypothetical protein
VAVDKPGIRMQLEASITRCAGPETLRLAPMDSIFFAMDENVATEVHGDIVITYGRYVSFYMPKTDAAPPANPRLNSIWFERVYAKRNGQ